MTTQQLYFFGCLYLVILAVVAVLTRATPRRIAGAMVGGAVVGVALLGIVAIGEKAGWWHTKQWLRTMKPPPPLSVLRWDYPFRSLGSISTHLTEE